MVQPSLRIILDKSIPFCNALALEGMPIQDPEFITFSFISKVIVYGCIFKIPNRHDYIFIETYTLVIITWHVYVDMNLVISIHSMA